jgi:hypothetical protein
MVEQNLTVVIVMGLSNPPRISIIAAWDLYSHQKLDYLKL